MPEKTIFSRRDILKAGGAAAAAPYFLPARVLGGERSVAPSDQIAIGVIGVGVRGKYLIGNMPLQGRVVALCDSFLDRTTEALEPKNEFRELLTPFAEQQAKSCTVHQDYRKMLESEKLDAVVIAAPDHHHIQAAMLACQAGLDVYLEKPLSVTIAEGRALVDAVERSGRVLQVGSQQRTMEMNRFACEFCRDGKLGRISRVELPCLPGPMTYQHLPGEPVPEGLGWDLFCGPTERRPHNRRLWIKDAFKVGDLTWRGWDLWSDYSGHLMTNWGGHSVDMAQYALGTDDTGPVEIWPEREFDLAAAVDQYRHKTPPPGTVLGVENGASRFAPVTMRYAGGTELRITPESKDWVFHGERGVLTMRRNRYRFDPEDLVTEAPDPRLAKLWEGAGHVAQPHLANWLECIVSRGTPNAPVEAGHRTATICHLANLARRLGRRLQWDPQRERFVGDDEANRHLERPRRPGFELPQTD